MPSRENKQLITFWLDKQKHGKFKVKAFLEHTDITEVLTKAVDAFIGKGDPVIKQKTISGLKTQINSIKPKKSEKPEPIYTKEE